MDRYGKDPELAKITDVEEQAAFMFKRAAEGLCIMLKGMYPDANFIHVGDVVKVE